MKLKDARDKDVESMSISSALAAHQKYHGCFNERVHMWFAAGTPRGSPSSTHSEIGVTAREHNIGLTMHCAEAPKDLEIYLYRKLEENEKIFMKTSLGIDIGAKPRQVLKLELAFKQAN